MAQPQIGGGSCSDLTLNKTYAISIATRQVTAGTFGAVQQQVGTAAFDGNGNAMFNTTINSNTAAGTANTTQATYSINANCTGALTAGSLTFNLIVYAQASGFTMTGNNNSQAVTGSGTQIATDCNGGGAGTFVLNGNGFGLSGNTVTGAADISGLFQTDGMGNLTATWTVANGTTSTTVNAKGQYSVGSNCQGGITVVDSTNNATYVFSFVIVGNGSNFNFIASNPALIFSGSGHATS